MTNNYYINGDLYDWLPKLPDKTFTAIISDLPYGVTQNESDKIINPDFLWHHLERLCFDESTPIILTSQYPFTQFLINSKPPSFRYYDLVIWNKILPSGHLNARRQPLRVHEHVLLFYKKQLKYCPQMEQGKPLHSKGKKYLSKEIVNRNYGDFQQLDDTRKGCTEKYPQSIISFQKIHPSKAVHATEKPVELAQYLLNTYHPEKQGFVLDMCAGVGWVARAAHQRNLNFFCIELDTINHNNGKIKLDGDHINYSTNYE